MEYDKKKINEIISDMLLPYILAINSGDMPPDCVFLFTPKGVTVTKDIDHFGGEVIFSNVDSNK